MTTLRIATFNLENFDETAPDAHPSLDERITLMRPQIERLRADIVCFQEVNGQERDGQPRDLHALRRLLEDTNLDAAETASTRTATKEVFDERNLVVASVHPISGSEQLKNDLVAKPLYRQLTADPPDETAEPVEIERPILHVEISVDEKPLHVINVHLKSKLPSDVAGRKIDAFTWKTADSWAEGAFISSMKRMSQAVEVRRLVDRILDDDGDARIVVAGDFNATPDEVPVLAIRGAVEDTGNGALTTRVLVPVEHTVPEPARYTLYHQGKGQMLDHMLVTRNLLAHYRGSEIHNELLHDESAAFADDRKYPESDHAPVVAAFEF
ncbi:endonuclease/exonuclease/phosphatase family protein [Amycolatopsis sacchari]|uniref:Endonuclease/Exonuclease/phosphatase family protein n=1 Tax=Amycolatopsis sacchari TaxID=115433 RepID=A0A1I3ML67_9PSEU|nr:endonuclease/exonuclease/phosphatase family protein [Amycolatopsis sacchari]SFI97426.1 Endonuclease/Exonuclease/phosphatase family protein [Amycolatopsis sacchari]